MALADSLVAQGHRLENVTGLTLQSVQVFEGLLKLSGGKIA